MGVEGMDAAVICAALERAGAVFEDEALNSELSPTVITAYLKQRLEYGERAEPKRAACELPEVKLVFDHDIFEDGG